VARGTRTRRAIAIFTLATGLGWPSLGACHCETRDEPAPCCDEAHEDRAVRPDVRFDEAPPATPCGCCGALDAERAAASTPARPESLEPTLPSLDSAAPRVVVGALPRLHAARHRRPPGIGPAPPPTLAHHRVVVLLI